MYTGNGGIKTLLHPGNISCLVGMAVQGQNVRFSTMYQTTGVDFFLPVLYASPELDEGLWLLAVCPLLNGVGGLDSSMLWRKIPMPLSRRLMRL